MKRYSISAFAILFIGATVFSQRLISPGENLVDKKWIKDTKYELACFATNGSQWIEVSSFAVQVSNQHNKLAVYTALTMYSTNEKWLDTSIADANTMRPVYRSSFNPNREFALYYNKEVTGYYYDKKLKSRLPVKEAVKGPFFDSYIYTYILGGLPLQTGYKADLPVYDYKPGNASHIKVTSIKEVKSNIYKSDMTGEHAVWQVSVFEEATNESYQYFIGKNDRKLWKAEVVAADGQRFLFFNKELDYNPFTTRFDKESTLKLIQSGRSTISGVAFARDNENEGLLKGMAILNINKKQYAKQGTTVLLIPYTPYFKEWIALNEKLRKKGRSVPLTKEAADCIKLTTVFGDKGEFEFTNLMPGEYVLYTEFGYVHTSNRTEVVGYTDTYINGMFHASTENTETFSYSTNASANIKKFVTIKRDGETAEVKLKKTL